MGKVFQVLPDGLLDDVHMLQHVTGDWLQDPGRGRKTPNNTLKHQVDGNLKVPVRDPVSWPEIGKAFQVLPDGPLRTCVPLRIIGGLATRTRKRQQAP